MNIRAAGSSFAHFVEGVELWRGLQQSQVQKIAELWSQHGLVIFRRQSLTEEELVEFSRGFGEPEQIVRKDWAAQTAPEVILISNLRNGSGQPVGGLGSGELGWHSDQSYVLNPATGSILYMVEMPPNGGRTFWANLALAYQALPNGTKQKVADLRVTYDYAARLSTYEGEPPMTKELRQKTPIVTHPLVHFHPVTGAPSLYMDPTTMTEVVGMTEIDGRQLIDELTAHVTKPEFIYSHDWQVGDVVMWDNGFLLHRRDPFDNDSLRLLKRTTLKLPADRHIVPETALFGGYASASS